MNNICKNCGSKIEISIFKGGDWCCDDCRKALNDVSHLLAFKTREPICLNPDTEDFVVAASLIVGRACPDCEAVMDKWYPESKAANPKMKEKK